MKPAYLVDTLRTPIGSLGGSLASVRADDLAAHVLRELVARNSGLDPHGIEDVILGCANQAGKITGMLREWRCYLPDYLKA